MAKLWAFFLLCIIPFIGADWQDVVKKECRHASDADSFLQPGHVYKYRYHAVGNGAAVGTSDRSSEIALDCSVTVSAATGCLYNLDVSSCKVTAKGGPEGQEAPWIQDQDLSAVSQHPVLFSLNNGKLGSIFAMPADPLYSLNIKRGIISGFGISKSSADGEEKIRRDVHGTCPVTATSHGTHIGSSKNMLFCRHPSRPDWHLSPWSLFWNMSFIQPLINSSAECDYTVNDAQNQLSKVSCHERHAIYLDSSQFTANAVQTNVRYLLELEDARQVLFKHQYRLNEMRATGIELEYEHTPEPQTQPPNFNEDAQKILSDLVLVSQDAIELRTVPLFRKFVALLRTSTDLIPFVNTVTSCRFLEGVPRCNKQQKELAISYLKDAVMQCNTGPCMGGFRHLVVRDQVSRIYLTIAFLSWTNIPITNPTYIEELLVMCKHTEMKICWLALGTAIHKYSEDHSDVPKSIKDTVTHLSSYIGEECNVEDVTFPSSYTTSDKQEYLLTAIKTIGNIGDLARNVHHGIVRQLYACAASKDAPQEISIGAIKALHRMKPNNYIHKKLLFLLKDNQRSVGVRLASYDILMKLFDDDELIKEIANLLSSEKSTQVKCYIVTDIERIRGESDEKDPESFAYKLLEQLKEASVFLEDFQCSDYHHSSSHGGSYFFNMNLLPEDMRRFGIKRDRKTVFDTLSAFPYSHTRNITVELFSHIYNILETGITAKNWEEFGIWVRRQLADPNIHTGQWFVQNFIEIVRKLGIKGLIPIVPGSEGEELNFVFPDQRVADNLKKTIKQFLQSNTKGKPMLELYLKTFGNELGFVTLNGIFSFLTGQYQWLANQNIGDSLKKGITFNRTFAFEFIEAYHHVPTLMGLPLNWSTKSTYILSPRITVDADLGSGERTENVAIEYSEAGSMVNAMILELPTVTQVGVQANTSWHTALDTHLSHFFSESKHLREITYKPTGKRQKYIEIYRTNQQIQHDRYEDIPDWSTTRQDKKFCTSDRFNEIVGGKFCRERSFPVLPLEMITSTMIAGWAKSEVYAELVDRGIKEYKLSIIRPPVENGIYDLKVKFKAPGTQYKREAQLNLYLNTPTQEGNFELIVPEVPDLEIKGVRERIRSEDGVATGLTHHWVFQTRKDHRYEMKYNYNEQTESGPEVRARRSRGKTEFLSRVQERTIDLHTPYNVYNWASKLHKHENNMKAEALLSYENLNKDWNWPAAVLADSLWETDNKAWVQFEADWETRYDPETPDHFHRHTVNTLNSPKRTVSIVSHRMKMPGRVIFEVNATALEKENLRLLTYANFSYNLWKSGNDENGKEIRNINLKIPHYVWNIHGEKEESEFERAVNIKLDRTREVPSSDEENEAGGWWDHTHDGHVEELSASYRGHIKAEKVENQLLPTEWREKDYVRNKDQRFRGYNVIMDIAIAFPANGKEETITMKGNSLRLYGDRRELPKRPTTTTDFLQWLDAEASDSSLVLHNTFNNGHREIKTVTGARQGWVKRWITHTDTSTLANGEKIKYVLNLLWGEKERCEYADFNHKFSSSFYTLEADALLECKPRTKAYHIQLNSKSQSEWDMLNSNTHQQFYLERHLEGWEVMNFTHPALDIDAAGQIGMDLEGPYYNKRWDFKSKTDLLPNAVITFGSKLTTSPYTELNASIPDEGIELARLRTNIARDGSGFNSYGYHILTSDPGKEIQHSSYSLKLLTPYKYSVRGYYNLDHLLAITNWAQHKLVLLAKKIEDIRNDPNHPLNRLKRATRKAFEKEEEYWRNAAVEMRKNQQEIRKILYPFFEPTVETLCNIHEVLGNVRQNMRDNYLDSSVPGYIEQLEIRKHAQEAAENTPYLVMDAAKSYFGVDPKSRIITFSYTGPHGLYWESLLQAPQTFEGTWRLPALRWMPYANKEILFRSRYIVPPFYKTAMIFGPHHVYTFDGKMYEFPDYPIQDCTYMLLHDVRHQSFSVLTSAHKLHLMFPELTVTIGQDEKIHLNNSRQQSEVPYESPNGKVAVTREGSITVVETIGLKVICDVPRMFCIFALDPFHHSGTMGLLGNADGEAFNDFTLPEGKSVETAAEMARGYEVSNRKRCRQIQEKEKPQWSREVQSRCVNAFTSPRYSACTSYLEIDESLFKEACRWDAHEEKDVCASPNALAGYCTVHGKKTAPCSPPQNWYLKTVNSAYKLEVIIVMDQHNSMFSNGLKGLESLLGAIEDEFKPKGYSSVLFTLIGFGGKGVRYHPHIQTPDTNIWHSHKDMVANLNKTLQFNGKHRGDALEAVKYAASILPFDMQSSRIMLLFTVDDVDSYFAGLKVSYLHSLLESYSITLYTFADFPSIDKGKKVFGVRADGYIFPHPKKGAAYMDYPTTEKAKLTSGTRGAIFLRRFAENNEPFAFFKFAAEEFRSKVGNEVSKCRKCIWKLNHWWDIQHECELSDDCKDQ